MISRILDRNKLKKMRQMNRESNVIMELTTTEYRRENMAEVAIKRK